VVLVDNGRSAMLGTEFQEMLRCIKCGACMNHCPVYGAIGGHAYDAVYMGPMGAVLTPQIEGLFGHTDLPAASTFCGRCAEVCPMGIPLPDLMRRWREQSFAAGWSPSAERWGLGLWSALARRPVLYRLVARVAAAVLKRLGSKGIARLPLTSGWTAGRDMPAPAGRTFSDLWAEQRRG